MGSERIRGMASLIVYDESIHFEQRITDFLSEPSPSAYVLVAPPADLEEPVIDKKVPPIWANDWRKQNKRKRNRR